jgi:hypothetical protein
MNHVFKFLMVFAVVSLSGAWAFADTVLMKDNQTYDGKVISNSGGLIRMQAGDHEVVLPAADVANVEINEKRGKTANYEEIERLAAERDRELTEKTGLDAQKRAAVDEMLQYFFSGDEAATQSSKRMLLEMAKKDSPYRYLQMRLPEIVHTKVAPLLEVMFRMNPGDMRETLRQYAVSTSETARAESLRCLLTLKDKSTLELMKRGMADEDPGVRIAAAQGVEALGARVATPVLLKALKGADLRVQNASREALSSLWTEPGQPPLNFLKNSGWEEFWKSKAAGVPGAWNPDTIEPLVPPGTVTQID